MGQLQAPSDWLLAGSKTNVRVRTREFVLVCTYVLGNVSYERPVNVGRPHLVRSPRFIPESMFYTQSVLFSSRFRPKSLFYTPFRSPYFILTV